MIRITVEALIVVILIVISFSILNYSVIQSEKQECYQWQKEAKEIRKEIYYLVGWQKEQCDHYGITINARVLQ